MSQPTSVNTLIEALPYIREFRGKTFVVRCAADLDTSDQEALSRDIGILRFAGVKAVVVHAREALDVGTAERRGINHRLVHAIGKYGRATGLAGSDGAPRWLLSTDTAGELSVDPDLVFHVIEDYTPVIEAVAVGTSGEAVPADPDLVAARLAVALDAYKVLFVVGDHRVIAEGADDTTAAANGEISEMRASADVVDRITIDADLRKPFDAALEAIESGKVNFAHLIPNDLPHAMLLELFTERGYGTKIRSPESWRDEEWGKDKFPSRGYFCWESDPREEEA